MRVEIARLHKEIGATMIYVTHDQVKAMSLADKIRVLRSSSIEQVGAPLELYRNPDNKLVAGFIDSSAMNFPDGVVTDGRVYVLGLNDSFKVPVMVPAEGAEVSLGLRPEHIEVDPADDTNIIDLTEAPGGTSYVYLVSEKGEKVIVEEYGDERSEEGLRVGIKFSPDRTMLFDRKTEARIR